MVFNDSLDYQEFLIAAFLHDIGKLEYRKGKSKKHQELGAMWVKSMNYSDLIQKLIQNHHDSQNITDQHIQRLLSYLKKADQLSASQRERRGELEKDSKIREAPLISILSKIELTYPSPAEKFIPIEPLSIQQKQIFPIDNISQYKGPSTSSSVSLSWGWEKLWNKFIKEIQIAMKFNKLNDLETLNYIIRKYTWCVPSAAYVDVPDIALYNHMKDTAAIAACLYLNEGVGKFLLIGGDFSGIQKYIFEISNAPGVGRRLRGRSFELILISKMITSYICEQLNLFSFNIIYNGGGVFYILAPDNESVREKLQKIEEHIDKWFLKRYAGKISLVLESVSCNEQDFQDFSVVFEQISDKLNIKKLQKFPNEIGTDAFFVSKIENKGACRSCNFNIPVSNQDFCEACNQHSLIGTILSKTNYLIEICHSDSLSPQKNLISFPEFNRSFYFLEQKDLQILRKFDDQKIIIYQLNDTANFIWDSRKNASFGYFFVGNKVPTFLQDVQYPQPSARGTIVSFDILEKLNVGAEKIGILKGDIDNLGLIFSLGLDRDGEQSNKTISRISTLSDFIDLFFSGFIQTVITDFSQSWTQQLKKHFDPTKEKDKAKLNLLSSVDGLIYLLYSGGDDFMVIGPWDAIIKLAFSINAQFSDFCCNNPNLRLSAGIFLCDGKFPIRRSAKISDNLEKISKSSKNSLDQSSKNSLTTLGVTQTWEKYIQLQTFGEEIEELVRTKNLSKSLLYRLFYLTKQFKVGTNEENIMWVPQIHYMLTRNILERNPSKRIEEIAHLFINNSDPIINLKNIIYPVSWMSLRTR